MADVSPWYSRRKLSRGGIADAARFRNCTVEQLEDRRLLTFTNFVHPGVLNTAADFTRMATKVAANAQPWLADWQLLQRQGYAVLANPRPLSTIIRGGTGQNYAQMYIDIERSYDTALEWKVTGNTVWADQTVRFLNAWSYTMTTLTGDADRFLASGLYGFQWANIAEIMRTYSGWAAADQTQFQNYLLNVYIPKNQQFLATHNDAYITNYWANWDLCNIASEMAIGVFTDRHDLYDAALNYVYTGGSNGAFDKVIYYMHAGNLGQGQEEGRDQGHSNLDFEVIAEICQTAWNQGDDLFGYRNNEILAGVEYLAKYNLGNDVPFESYEWGSGQGGTWEQQTAVADGSRGTLAAFFDLMYSHYVILKGLTAPYTATATLDTRPEGDTSRGDSPGWGTLTFALDPIATVQPPQSLVAYEKGTGNIQLNWWGGDNDSTYNVYRATSSSGPFTEIASGLTLFTYTDTNIPGGTYYYQITGVNGSTETAASNVAMATSSSLLVAQLKFDESSGTTASDSTGNSVTGTLNGGATFAAGESGNAVSLDGSTGYVSLPVGLNANLSDFTIAAWVYLNSSQTWARVFDFGDGRGDWMYLTVRNGSGVPQFATSTVYAYNQQSVAGTSALPTNQWVHLAVTFSNRLATLYVNGVAVGSNANMDFPPYEINGTTPNAWIGRSQYSRDPYLNGKIDDFRIYRGALPTGQVYTLATGNAAPAVPAAPATLTATAVVGKTINLSWSSVGGATSYSLYRSASSSGPFWPITTLFSGTTYSDTGLAADLTNGTPYYYYVTAANTGGEGAASPHANATALPPAPSVPTSLVANVLSASSVSLRWAAASNDASFTIRRSTTSGGPYTVIASGITATTYIDTGRTVGVTYYYVVAGDNAAGESANSNEDSATPTDLFLHLKFDDGSGGTAYDSSGNNWNGTLVNSPTWITAGKVNGAVNFNSASNQYVSLPSGVVEGQTAFTAAVWVYLTTSAASARIFDFGTGINDDIYLTSKNNSGVPRLGILVNGTERDVDGNAAIPTGVWTHIAATWANNVGTLYVNGIQVGQNTGMPWNPSPLGTTTQDYIGHSPWPADPHFNGSVDDFRLYAHALTSAQINALATTSVPAAPTGLVATPVSPTQVNLTWSTTTGATTYDVYRATTSGGPFQQYTQVASNLTTTSWQDMGVSGGAANGTAYYYVVSAEDAGGEGPQSTQASATVLPPLPDSPTMLNVAVTTSGSLALSWDSAANAASYSIARSDSATGPYTTIVTGVTGTTFTDTGLTNGVTYYYAVTSANAGGQGSDSPGNSGVPTDLYDYQKFDETSGTTAADASGHNFAGTLVKGATWSSSGKIGGAVSLNGASSQYVSLPSGVVAGLTSFSATEWVYLTTNITWMRVFDFGTGTTNNMFLTVHNGNNAPRFGIQTANVAEQDVDGTSAISTGVWTQIAVTWANNVGTLYVNGNQVGQNANMTLNPSSLGTTTQNYIGHSEFPLDPYLNGSVDDFRIYSRALSATEINTLAANTLPAMPVGLGATVTNSQATLSWSGVVGAATYTIQRGPTSSGPYTTITGGITGTSFTDTSLADGSSYYYVVSAVNVTGAGPNSINSLVVNGGTYSFPTPTTGGGVVSLTLASVAIGTGGKVTLPTANAHSDRYLMTLSTLFIAGSTNAWTGTLDLGGNDLDVAGGNLANETNQLKQGFNGGNWNGTGIISTAAKNDSTHKTTLGVASGLTSFDQRIVSATDVLVKYTYYGDANLDGVVNGNDYSLIDVGFGGQKTGWQNGDFNYDTKIDGSDYALIDNTFNMQVVSMASEISSSAMIAAEPLVQATAKVKALSADSPPVATVSASELFQTGNPISFLSPIVGSVESSMQSRDVLDRITGE